MSYEAEAPFDNIEGSHEYVAMLADALEEARRDVESDIAAADHDGADRRKQKHSCWFPIILPSSIFTSQQAVNFE